MFAAFQKASWNWTPVSVSRPSLISADDRSSDHNMHGRENDPIKAENRKIAENQLPAKSPEWIEIGLISDDDEQISPRGILQFRKMSAGSEKLKYKEDPPSSSTDMVTLVQQQLVQSAFPFVPAIQATEAQATAKNGETPSKTIMLTDLAYEEDENNVGTNAGQQGVHRNDIKAAQVVSRASASTEQYKKIEGLTTTCRKLEMSSLLPEALTSENDPTIAMVKSLQHRSQISTGTQTLQQTEDFARVRKTLERQLEDALQALEYTRRQADAVRERMRMYTSNMKQESNDMRSTSMTLSHTLDKIQEYRTKWKEEIKLKDQARQKADELDSNVRSLQKVMAEKDADIKAFGSGVDALIRLLCDDVHCGSVGQKLAFASGKVSDVLDLLEKQQVDAALSTIVSTVELKESFRRFEEEKMSLLAFTKSNDEAHASTVQNLEAENRSAKDRAEALKQTSDEIRAKWQLANRESDSKDRQLKQNMNLIRHYETTLAKMQTEMETSISNLAVEVKEKEALCKSFQGENLALTEQKLKIEETLAQLERQLTEKDRPRETDRENLAVKDQAVNCILIKNNSFSDESDPQMLQSQLRSFSRASEPQIYRGEIEIQKLQREIDELKHAVMDKERDFENAEHDYLRLRGDFRQLSWTAHHQQVTLQKVRAENRSLRISISKLKCASEGRLEYNGQDSGQQNISPNESYGSASNVQIELRHPSFSGNGTESSDERERLQTIQESSDEEPTSTSRDISPTNSQTAFTAVREPTPSGAAPLGTFPLEKNGVAEVVTDDLQQGKEQTIEKGLSVFSNCTADVRLTPKRKRSRKAKRSYKTKLPIWRQENPGNQFSTERSWREPRRGSDSSSGSEDVFVPSNSSSTSERQDLPLDNVAPQQPRRLVGIPMSESDFEKIVGSFDYDRVSPVSHPSSRLATGCDITITNDDGYASSALELTETGTFQNPPNNSQQHWTIILPHRYASSDDSSLTSGRVESTTRHGRGAHRCLVAYRGATFDAASFGLAKMRQFTWEAGIAECESEMNKFIDFLAEKAERLDQDPKWRGRHSLGKPSDWLSLKGLLC